MKGNLPIQASGKPALLAIEAPVELQAASSDDPGRRPTFHIEAYNGGPMRLKGFAHPVIVDLATAQVPAEVPIYRDHDPTRLVGQGIAALSPSNIAIDGTVTGDNADSQDLVAHAKNGFKWKASIGGSEFVKVPLAPGKTAVVNGRTVTGPMIIARNFILSETSFVPSGADRTASATIAAESTAGIASGTEKDFDMNFEQWLKARKIDPATLSDDSRAALQAAYEGEQALQASGNGNGNQPLNASNGNGANGTNGGLTATSYESIDDIFQSANRARARNQEIRARAASMLNDHPGYVAEIQAMAHAAVDNDQSPDEFELQCRRICRPETGGRAGFRRADDGINNNVIEAAVCRTMGLANYEEAYPEQVLEAAHRHFPHGIGLQEVLLRAANQRGHRSFRIGSNVEPVLRAAFQNEGIQAAGGFSTISIPGILGNSANKMLVDFFMAVESAWRKISARRPVNDFKQVSSYAVTGDLEYELVGASGELKHGSASEETYTNQADTYGKILAITRKDIINDDLGAFRTVLQRLGRGGAMKFNKVFWSAFMDNSTFFTSARGNYDDGTDTALDTAGLKKAIGLYKALTNPDGEPLGSTLRYLVVPPGQTFAAQELMTSTNHNTGGSASTAQVPNRNVLAGLMEVVESTYLANSTITGYSALAYYMLCDPNDLPVIESCFLNGQETPTVESADADFDVLGIKMRGFYDFGVTKQEWRGGFKAKGEA